MFASGSGTQKIVGCLKLRNVNIIQSLLHNTKGSASRLLGVMGRTLPPEFQHELLQVIAHVSRRYNPRSLPCDSKKQQRLVRGRFTTRINLTGYESRIVMGRLKDGLVVPLPFH